jgi:hypothetical protein
VPLRVGGPRPIARRQAVGERPHQAAAQGLLCPVAVDDHQPPARADHPQPRGEGRGWSRARPGNEPEMFQQIDVGLLDI